MCFTPLYIIMLIDLDGIKTIQLKKKFASNLLSEPVHFYALTRVNQLYSKTHKNDLVFS